MFMHGEAVVFFLLPAAGAGQVMMVLFRADCDDAADPFDGDGCFTGDGRRTLDRRGWHTAACGGMTRTFPWAGKLIKGRLRENKGGSDLCCGAMRDVDHFVLTRMRLQTEQRIGAFSVKNPFCGSRSFW